MDIAIIRSSRPVLFCKKDILKNFAKFTRKHPKKRFRLRCFHVNSVKFLKPLLKNPSDSCFGINISSIYFPTMNFRIFKNYMKNIFWLSKFLGLICRLGETVSSIFQALTQKPIFNPVEHHLIDGPFFA